MEAHEKGIEAGIESSGMAGWDHIEERAADFLKAYLSASNQVLVPRKVSREMDSAGYEACTWNILDPSKKDHQDVYYAMVSAAPNPFSE